MFHFSKLFIAIYFIFISFDVFTQEYLTHSKLTILLNKHVDTLGHVDYAGIKEDEKLLDEYLSVLSTNPPTDSWEKMDRLAFWINAYNAFTIKLIVKNYPIKSIKELGGSIYKVNTPWDIKFITIGDKVYDLNNIEHGIIREQFNDPRIHFAVNCASVSCPNLRNEAFVGNILDVQLNEQAKGFINDISKNRFMKGTAKLSKIFKWFKGDFSKNGGSVAEFINKYAPIKITKKTKIEWLDYDWNLNE